jgi:hypothetical protein
MDAFAEALNVAVRDATSVEPASSIDAGLGLEAIVMFQVKHRGSHRQYES